ncbi:putative esterase [Lacinutrix venerupis]|uniref:alpha/beta hydrolase n=1 Tax=Lacinutrix venerupis TaxID=1486034 RepID=UPI000EAE1CFB|nr:esterase [Lacinutrix venerupis]RLJ68729.1 putative esterase [Lacinutrix venerupis]
MQSTQKEIFYTTTKPYSTLNKLTEKTKNVWFVCHGMGYLSKYFIKYFKNLNTEENYIIAPQAPSLYYQKGFKHVGASWLTKENTLTETENIMSYFDAVLAEEKIPNHINLIVLGYSQGVSVATRYIKNRQLHCTQLVLHSGGIPKELVANDFKHLKAKVSLIYGTEDEYLNEERIAYETSRAYELFGKDVNIIPFNGKHVVNVDIINGLV